MPIAYEVVALALLAYTIGLAIGWAVWGRSSRSASRSEGEN